MGLHQALDISYEFEIYFNFLFLLKNQYQSLN